MTNVAPAPDSGVSGQQQNEETTKKQSYFSNGDNGTTKFSDGLTDFKRAKHPIHTPTGSTEVLTFYPTLEEFRDFSAYVAKIEAAGAHTKCGIAKIVPPEGWTPRPNIPNYNDVDDYVIKCPVTEIMSFSHRGVYRKLNEIYKNQMTVKEYRKMAKQAKYRTPEAVQEILKSANFNPNELENYFFSHLEDTQPIYGADTEGSIYEEGINEFNMNNLGTVLDDYKKVGIVRGVNTVYLYFGMYKTCFPWHAEDMDLYSINYLHFGSPKYWFAIPAEAADRFEKILDQYYPDWKSQCKAFPRHKLCMVSPEILRQHGIPFGTMIQRENEFIITFPRGYHMGFNTGYNCAESTNFATDRWIDYGKNVVTCQCKESVLLDMQTFMRKYRASEEANWRKYWYSQKVKYITSFPYPPGVQKCKKSKAEERAEERQGDKLKRKRGNWMKRFPALYSRTAPNLYEEKLNNKIQAHYFPHCAVCSLFWPESHISKEPEIPARSKRLVKSLFFAKNTTGICDNDPEEDDLVTCENCHVTVHPSCYGGPIEGNLEKWLCFRCRDKNDVAIRMRSCNLCEMRSGALLPCEIGIDKGFVHVVCGIMNRRTSFNSSIGPTKCVTYPSTAHAPKSSAFGHLSTNYITAEGDFTEQSRWHCDICQNMKEGLIVCALCRESTDEPDRTMAHTTCGKQAGFLFEERQYPHCTTMICDRHIYETFGQDELMLLEGASVFFVKGNSVDDGIVKSRFKENRISVQNLNGTFKTHVKYDAVISCTCPECDGFEHKEGAKLRIRLEDGREEDCYFRASYTYTAYTVHLHNGREVLAHRKDLFLVSHSYPPKYRRRIEEYIADPSRRERFAALMD